MNRGGAKLDPATIDEFLLAYPGVEDAAAFGFARKTEMEEIAIALVVEKT